MAKGFVALVAVAIIAPLLFLNLSSLLDPIEEETSNEKNPRTTFEKNSTWLAASKEDSCTVWLSSLTTQRRQELDNIPTVSIPRDRFSLLHIGKAGGGTFHDRTRRMWKIKLHECHPNPCKNTQQHFSSRNNTNSTTTLFVVTIRDPVDRFVSAFQWRVLTLCHFDANEKRTPGFAANAPDKFCQNHSRTTAERHVVFAKYQQNANALAEALCSHNQNSSSVAATTDLQTILHAKHSIQDWLGNEWKHAAARNTLFPIVLEDRVVDFESQIDDAVHWILYHQNDIRMSGDLPKDNDLALRQERVRLMDCEQQQQQQNTTIQSRQKSRHSSSSLAGKQHGLLSPRGEACLVQYYRRDYEILEELKDLACQSDNCRMAIQSMLLRRAPLLTAAADSY